MRGRQKEDEIDFTIVKVRLCGSRRQGRWQKERTRRQNYLNYILRET